MFMPIRARIARNVCNMLVIICFIMNIIIFHSFWPIFHLYVHALTIFLFSLYLMYFDYCHIDATCYLSSLLHYFFFRLE